MDEISLVFGGIQIAAIVGGIVLALMELRHLRMQRKTELETRQAQFFMQVYDRLTDEEFVKNYLMLLNEPEVPYDEMWTRYFPASAPARNFDALARTMTPMYFLEGPGVLTEKGLMSPELVVDLLGKLPIRIWEKYESFVREFRRRATWPSWFDHVEKLYHAVNPVHDKAFPNQPET